MTTGSVQLVDRDHRVRLHTNRVEKKPPQWRRFNFFVHSNQISSTNDDDFFTEKIWFKKRMKLYDFSLIINEIIKSKSLVLIFPSFNNLVTLKYDPKEGKSQLVWTNPTGSHVCLHDERRCCDQTALNANRQFFFFLHWDSRPQQISRHPNTNHHPTGLHPIPNQKKHNLS